MQGRKIIQLINVNLPIKPEAKPPDLATKIVSPLISSLRSIHLKIIDNLLELKFQTRLFVNVYF